MRLTPLWAALAFAIGFWAAWNLQAHQITKLNLEQANERISIQRAARATLERNMSQLATAQAAAAGRANTRHSEDGALRTVIEGLRDDLIVTRGAAATTIDACNRHSNTITELFIEAVGVGRELAQACDGHASDVRTLMDAWPK